MSSSSGYSFTGPVDTPLARSATLTSPVDDVALDSNPERRTFMDLRSIGLMISGNFSPNLDL